MRKAIYAFIGIVILVTLTAFLNVIGFIIGLIIVIMMSHGIEKREQHRELMQEIRGKK